MIAQRTDINEKTVTQYFNAVEENEKIHGEKTFVFMLVGGFYESYVKYDKVNDVHFGSPLWELKDVLRAEPGEKKFKLDNPNHIIKMWGVQDHHIDIREQYLLDHGYKVVFYRQEKDSKGNVTGRYLSHISTPGTSIPKDGKLLDTASNNTSCMIFKLHGKGEKKISYGYSNYDVLTGHTSIFEGETENTCIDHTTFNELENYIINNTPRELLIVTNVDDNLYDKIKKSVGLMEFDINKFDFNDIKSKNCFKPEYIENTIKTVYKNSDYFSGFEFYELSTSSLCFLIDYINIYNPLALEKITSPNIIDNDKLLLANHTLQQLNIISINNNTKCKKLSSVLSSLNNCITTLGKRKLTYQLLNPTRNINVLNKEYNMIEYILNNPQLIITTRNALKSIHDTDFLLRKITLKKYLCSDVLKLYNSLTIFKNLMETFPHELLKYIYTFIDKDVIDNEINNFLNNIDNLLNMKLCNINDIKIDDIDLIKPKYDNEYDEIRKDYKNKLKLDSLIIKEVNYFLKTEIGENVEYLQNHVYEKTQNDIKITKVRTEKVKELLKRLNYDTQSERSRNNNVESKTIIKINNSPNIYNVDLNDFIFKSKDKNNNIIQYKLINETREEIFELKDKLIVMANNIFTEITQKIIKGYSEKIERLSNIVGIVDTIICKAYNAKTMNYCKPVIEDNEKSFVNVNGLRHQLIELLLTDEKYVTNDITLGKEKSGMLLYGTNAVGKTSFIKALGISIIMAQAGMYVPAEHFVYKPYNSIYSRILGNDNLHKGLSTFQVEVIELKTIVKFADENSLILGDEICSGTEYESAISINTRVLKELNKKKSTYTFATHLHELVVIPEISEIIEKDKLYIKHMSVHYDNSISDLIYERKFKDGNGSTNYGLEVIKKHFSSVDNFMEDCFDIRNILLGNDTSLLTKKKSRYNAKVLKEKMCELCKVKKASDIHHIEEQCKADENGFIGSVKKNAAYNLVNLCKDCHKCQNEDEHPYKIIKKVKTTSGYKLELFSGHYV